MRDLLFLLAFVSVVTSLGLPIARLLPAERVGDRDLAAPGLGLAALGAAATIAYAYGLTPTAFIGALAISAAILLARPSVERIRRAAPLPLLAGAALAVVLLLPPWVGGSAFKVFQANPYDQAEYQTMALAYSRIGYGALRHIYTTPGLMAAADRTLVMSAWELEHRPANAIVFASFFPLLGGSTFATTAGYLAALQICAAFSLAFVARQFGCGRPGAALALGALFVAGFFGQHVLDLDAWGLLSGTPAVLVVFGITGALMRRDGSAIDWRRRARAALALAVALGGALYLYPEASAVYAPACLAVAALGAARGRGAWPDLATLASGALAGVALACVDFRGGIGSFFSQVHDTIAVAAWAYFYDAYVLSPPLDIGGWTKPLTVAAYAANGMLGLFSLDALLDGSPGRSALDLAAVATLPVSAAVVWWRARDRALPAAVLACLALVGGLAAVGRLWEAGKAFSMAFPLWFLLLGLPALAARPRWLAVPAVAFLAVQGWWAADRVYRAPSPGGHFREWPDYGLGDLKARFEVDPLGWHEALAGCRSISIDVETRAVGGLLRLYLQQGDLAGRLVAPGAPGACRVVDRDVEASGDGRVIDLRRRGAS